MPISLFPQDDDLPTWLHTLLLLLIVSPFALPLFYWGIEALITARLAPLSGPEFGEYFFGQRVLQGKAAKLAGLALVSLGLAFLSIAVRFSRLPLGRLLRLSPWLLLGLHVVLSMWARALP